MFHHYLNPARRLADYFTRRTFALGIVAALFTLLHVSWLFSHPISTISLWLSLDMFAVTLSLILMARAYRRNTQRFFQSALDSLEAHIAVLDAEGRVIAVNAAWSHFASTNGAVPGNGLGLNYLAICEQAVGPDAETAQQVAGGIRGVRDGILPSFTMEYCCPTPEAERWFVIRVSRFTDQEGARVVVAHEDVTERRSAEQQRLKLQSQRYEARRFETVGALAEGIAHDFNNVLMAIGGHAELALLDIPPISPAGESLRAIVHSVKRAAELTSQILVYAGRFPSAVQPISLNTVISELHELLRSTTRANVSLRYRLAAELPLIDGDQSQISQVLINLVHKAREAVAGCTGMITIATEEVRLQAAHKHLSLEAGPYVRLTVSDTAGSINQTLKERSREPLFSTGADVSDLDLAAVQSIVRSHGGVIEASSASGEGTTLEVWFPVSTASTEQSRKEPLRFAPVEEDIARRRRPQFLERAA